jgi:hypothetical protein
MRFIANREEVADKAFLILISAGLNPRCDKISGDMLLKGDYTSLN